MHTHTQQLNHLNHVSVTKYHAHSVVSYVIWYQVIWGHFQFLATLLKDNYMLQESPLKSQQDGSVRTGNCYQA